MNKKSYQSINQSVVNWICKDKMLTAVDFFSDKIRSWGLCANRRQVKKQQSSISKFTFISDRHGRRGSGIATCGGRRARQYLIL